MLISGVPEGHLLLKGAEMKGSLSRGWSGRRASGEPRLHRDHCVAWDETPCPPPCPQAVSGARTSHSHAAEQGATQHHTASRGLKGPTCGVYVYVIICCVCLCVVYICVVYV